MTAATVFGIDAWLLAFTAITGFAASTWVLVIEPRRDAQRSPGDVALDEYERIEADQ